MNQIIFWSLASHGTGLSGGDRIFIEFAKRWSKLHKTRIVTWDEGIAMMMRNDLDESNRVTFHKLNIAFQANFLLCYLCRIVVGLIESFRFKIVDPENTLLYSSSEFWMDSLPCAVLKVRYPKLEWVATWYQTAPFPLKGFSQGSRLRAYRSRSFYLWITQLFVWPFVNWLSDIVLVNNELEKSVFPNKKTIVVLGAVDTSAIAGFNKSEKKYDAVFQGRFHPQKGVVELIDIWRKVVDNARNAKLIMIGDGPLMPDVKDQIRKLNLSDNVKLVGYVFDGPEKYKIFSESKIVVHPAFFDSGGMAAAEAMAFGIPAIGFDLPAYRTYYPVGFVTVPREDTTAFASTIISLLKDSKRRFSLGSQAAKFIFNSYSWDYRATEILQQIVEMTDLEKDTIATH